MYFVDLVDHIEVGVQGENLNDIVIDVSSWMAVSNYPSFEIVVEQPETGELYLADTERDGVKLIWHVQDGDVAVSGKGKCDIRMYDGTGDDRRIRKTKVVETIIYETIHRSISPDVPEAAQGWVDQVAANGLKAEGYAVGKQNGVPVEDGSPYYENNAKYYAESIEGSVEAAQEAALSAISAYTGAQLAEAQAETAKTSAETAATNAAASATSAAGSATSASVSATAAQTAQTAAETAQTAAEAAQTAAEAAQEGAETAETNAETAQTAAEAAATRAETAAESIESIEPRVDALETASMTSQTTAWNQLVQNGNFNSTEGWQKYSAHTLSVNDHVAVLTVNSSGVRSRIYRTDGAFAAGHKHFVHAELKASANVRQLYAYIGTNFVSAQATAENTWTIVQGIITPENNETEISLQYGPTASQNLPTGGTLSVRNVFVDDLTAIYGLGSEPTADAFRKMFPHVYYEYAAIGDVRTLDIDEIQGGQIVENSAAIGDLSELHTTAKSNLVDAINEAAGSANTFTWNGVKYVYGAMTPVDSVYGINKYVNNLLIQRECVDGEYINFDTGGTTRSESYFRTGYIPVVGGTEYIANHGRNYAWYNQNKGYISGAKGTGIQVGITAPDNAAFIRFTINKQSDGISVPWDLYFAKKSEYTGNGVTIPNLVIPDVKPWCYGMKINWIGDSIVDGVDFDEKVCGALGLIETDYGINGSTIGLKDDGTDGRNALCIRYSAMSDDADIVAVSCGTNDYQYSWGNIGTIESTENTTFYGALKTLCAGLINKYPKKLIFFTTPIKRAQPFDGSETPTDPFSVNGKGKTLREYCDIIKEVCAYYSIPVLDMWAESGLNPHMANQADMFDSIGTHPNTDGQKIMARRVCGWITQLGYIIP